MNNRNKYPSKKEATISTLAGRNQQIPESLLKRVRELRQRLTPAETILWECLRNRQLLGAKFRRQHNLGPFFADFYCHEARLIIEADGGIHQEQKEQDATRDEWAITHGFIVLRFKNEKILDDIERVLSTIAQSLRPLSSQERGMGVRSNG